MNQIMLYFHHVLCCRILCLCIKLLKVLKSKTNLLWNKSLKLFEDNLCHQSEGKYCTFAFFATGIKHKCPGSENIDKCEILNALYEKKIMKN